MREFFHGWRRKIGVMTLVIACMFAAGWIKSQSFHDEINSASRDESQAVRLSSQYGLILIEWVSDADGDSPFRDWYWPSWDCVIPYSLSEIVPELPSPILFLWEYRSSRYGVSYNLWLPYRTIVLPLTLLSAYLLLSKPPPKQKPAVTHA